MPDLFSRLTSSVACSACQVACTGLHGANRLASTSLLEGVVWGSAVAEDLATSKAGLMRDAAFAKMVETAAVPSVAHQGGRPADANEVEAYMSHIRKTMWEHVGVVRRTQGKSVAVFALQLMKLSCADGGRVLVYFCVERPELRGLIPQGPRAAGGRLLQHHRAHQGDRLPAQRRPDGESKAHATWQLRHEQVTDARVLACPALQARLIAKAAKRNKHSVGAHYIEDAVEEEDVAGEFKAAM